MQNMICYAFSFTVEAIIFFHYTSILFAPKKNGQKWFSIVGLYFVLFIASLFEYPFVNLILFFLFHFLFIIFQYRLHWLPALLHAALLTAIMGLSETMLVGILSRYDLSLTHITNDFYTALLFVILSKTFYFLMVFLLMYFFKGRQKYYGEYDKFTLILTLLPLASLFVMFALYIIEKTVLLSPSSALLISLSCLLLLFSNLLVFSIHQYSQRKSMEFTEMQLQLQKESHTAQYYKMLLEEKENHSILLHDIKKHLQSIAMLNAQKECDKVASYIEQLMNSSDLKESSRLCDNELLNAILCRYQRQCAQNNISFHADIRSGVLDFLTDREITSLFCNLLDNALEAAREASDAYIELSADKRERTPVVVITAVNSCGLNPFDSRGKILETRKPDKASHGFGLKSIQRVVDSHHGSMTTYYHKDTSTFHAVIAMRL